MFELSHKAISLRRASIELDSNISIDRAIIPAAGLGTRLRPITEAIPKEMLPLGRKPVLEYVLEEMREAGIAQFLIVLSPYKEMVRRYFGDGASWGVRCDYTIQPEPQGLGDAILCGESWTEGHSFAVAFGDCIVQPDPRIQTAEKERIPAARVLKTHVQQRSSATVLTEQIELQDTRRYGILCPAAAITGEEEAFRVSGLVEKPAPERAPSRFAVAARWAMEPEIFGYLRRMVADAEGETNLTDPVQALCSDGGAIWAVPLRAGERRLDVGGWKTYLMESARAAMEDAEFGAHVHEILCGEHHEI